MWLINGVIVAVVLAKLFIYGEPVTHKNSEASVAYWRHRNQSEQDSARVDTLLPFISYFAPKLKAAVGHIALHSDVASVYTFVTFVTRVLSNKCLKLH